jgi:hypothetical protein
VRDGVLQAQQHVAVAMGSLHGAVQQVPLPSPPFSLLLLCDAWMSRVFSCCLSPAVDGAR